MELYVIQEVVKHQESITEKIPEAGLAVIHLQTLLL